MTIIVRPQIDSPTTFTKVNNSEERNWLQVLTIIIACLSATTAGMLFSWTSPSIPKIISDKETYDISLEQASYFTVLPAMGQVSSCIVFSKLNDLIGRKYTLLLIAVPHITSWLLIATANSIYGFYAARLITGFGDACLFSTLPIYVAEIATPKVRGTWGNMVTFTIYVGQLLVNVIGSYFTVRMTAIVSVAVPVIFTVAFAAIAPESPYYLLQKQRLEAARKSLQTLRRRTNVDDELEMLRRDVERQMSETGSWKDLVIIDSNRRAIYAGVFLRASQQLGGIATFAVYTQYIFIKATGTSAISPTLATIIFMTLCTVFNLFASFTLDCIGRKKSYTFSCLLCGLVLSCETVYFFLDQYYVNLFEAFLQTFNWLPVLGMLLYIVFYSFGLGIVPTLMLGELFSSRIKGKGLCILNIIFAILVSLSTKTFQLLDTNFGLYAPFLMFSVSCLLSSVLAVFCVPETKGKTLEEIQQSLKS